MRKNRYVVNVERMIPVGGIDLSVSKTRMAVCALLMLAYMALASINFVANTNIQLHEQKEELIMQKEQNRKLFDDLIRQHHEIMEMEEHIRSLEKILGYQAEMYRQVVLEGRGIDFNLNRPSGLSPEALEYVLKRGMKGSGSDFIRLEKEHGVNAVAIAAISIHETGWGTSYLSRNKNNYFGWSAYTHDPIRSAASFSSRSHSIAYVGERIKVNYLAPGGKHYNGATLRGMNVVYAADPGWAGKISAVMTRLLSIAIKPDIAETILAYEPYKKKYHADSYYYPVLLNDF